MITTITVGPGGTNCYICHNEATKRGIIIDPAADANLLLAEIDKLGITIGAIVITHGHFDHIGAVDELRTALDAPVYASKNEAALANNQDHNGTAIFRLKPITVTVDKFLEEGEIDFSCCKMQVMITPGHTYGSVCLYNADGGVLFSGDTLFHQSYGRYDLPTGDFAALKQSIDRLFALPDETVVYPGHGSSTTIGYEKIHNLIRR